MMVYDVLINIKIKEMIKKRILLALLFLPQLLCAQSQYSVISPGYSWNYERSNADGTTDEVSLKLADEGEDGLRIVYVTPMAETVTPYVVRHQSSEYVAYNMSSGEEYALLGDFPDLGSSGVYWTLLRDGQWADHWQELSGTARVYDCISSHGLIRSRCFLYADGSEDAADVIVSGVGSLRGGLLVGGVPPDMTGGDQLRFKSLTDATGMVLFTTDDFSAERLGDFAYRPLLEEGKTWYCASFRSDEMKYDAAGVQWYFQFFISGDTLVDGRECMKLYANNYRQSGGTEYVAAAYEDGGRVYLFAEGSREAQLLYDFTAGYGDRVEVSLAANLYAPSGTLQKTGDYYAYVDGKSARWHYFNSAVWLEGVGSESGLLYVSSFGHIGANYKLLLCTVGDEVIYDANYIRRDVVTSVGQPHDKSLITSGTVYDLQGRKVSSQPVSNADLQLPRSIYIQNGRKFVVK